LISTIRRPPPTNPFLEDGNRYITPSNNKVDVTQFQAENSNIISEARTAAEV
jgi:hypothetical protein